MEMDIAGSAARASGLLRDAAYVLYARYFGKLRVVRIPVGAEGRELRCLFFDPGDIVRHMPTKLLPPGRDSIPGLLGWTGSCIDAARDALRFAADRLDRRNRRT